MLDTLWSVTYSTASVWVFGLAMGFIFTKAVLYLTPIILLYTAVTPLVGLRTEWNRLVLDNIVEIPGEFLGAVGEMAAAATTTPSTAGGLAIVAGIASLGWFALMFTAPFLIGVYLGLIIPVLSLFI